MLFTMHATIMIFFVVMPIMVGCFGNFLIHARRPGHGVPQAEHALVLDGCRVGRHHAGRFFVPGGHAAAGWTAYAPLSSTPQYSGVDWGQSLWLISLFVLGVSSMMGSINYITTVVNMRAPG